MTGKVCAQVIFLILPTSASGTSRVIKGFDYVRLVRLLRVSPLLKRVRYRQPSAMCESFRTITAGELCALGQPLTRSDTLMWYSAIFHQPDSATCRRTAYLSSDSVPLQHATVMSIASCHINTRVP